MTKNADLLHYCRLTLPHLTSPYKGEETDYLTFVPG